jgi:hypothetical protein
MLVERRRAFSFCSQFDFLPPFFFSMLAQWIQRHVEPQAESLLEQSARGLAESWMELDCVVSELKAMGESPVGLPFKMHIAVYLRGRHLAEFMEHQPRGLYGLILGPPPTFYRLLAACIRASNNVFEDDGVRKRLRLVVSSFDKELRSITQWTLDGLHWHGLTNAFNNTRTYMQDEASIRYYRQLASRGTECNKFDVPYPLPRELVMRGKDVEKDRKRQFVLDSCAFMSEFCRDRNPDAEAVARDRQGLERSDTGEGGGGGDKDDMSLRQQLIVGLCCMAASAQSRRPHVVTFVCFWLLLGPAFSVKNLELSINRYKFRSDVYNHLAVALATFFVSPDVVFSCLDLAQQNAYATAWECALARQRVFASYGLYAEERATFERWRQQVPVVSWIYDEMVMAHVGSQFHHLQESMLEALVYKKIHHGCSPNSACSRDGNSFKTEVEERMMRLLCVIHSTASGLNISDFLRSNLCVSLAVFKCLRVSFQWMWSVTNNAAAAAAAAPVGTAASGLAHLKLASRVLSSQSRNTLSRHLDPFLFPVPEGNMVWPDFIRNQLLDDNRDSLSTWWRNSRSWADRCYSLLFFYVHQTAGETVTWQNCESYLNLCDKTIGLYEASSSNRHYRLPVLRLLRAALKPLSRLKRSPCPLGMTKGRVDPNGLLLVGPEERLLSHLLAREPVLAPLILDFGRAATRFHSTF